MNKRKLAFLSGLTALGLLLAEYLLVVWAVLFEPRLNDRMDGFIEGTLWLALPALLAGVGLLVARKNPGTGGLIENWLGGLGLFFAVYATLPNLSTWSKMGLLNQSLLLSMLISTPLMLVSGILFRFLSKRENLPA